MDHSPSWEDNRFSDSQEISHILLNPKVHYRSHMCLPPGPILSKIDPAQAPTSHLLRSILISSSIYVRVFQVVSIPKVYSPKPCTHLSSPHTRYMLGSPHFSRFDHPNNIGWAVQIINLFIM